MTPELTILTLAALLQCALFALYSVLGNMQVGLKAAMSPRDTPIHLTGYAGRAQRAMANHFEGLILYGIAALTLTFTDKANETTALLSALYLTARLLYVPAYLFGLSPWRSLIWFAGFLATLAMLVKALL